MCPFLNLSVIKNKQITKDAKGNARKCNILLYKQILKAYRHKLHYTEAMIKQLKAQNRKIRLEKAELELNYFLDKNKSPIQVGILYRQFLQYQYEINGWSVKNKTNTYGIYLICQKENNIHLVHCRNWAQSKRIDNDIISQFSKAVTQYKSKNSVNSSNMQGVFYTTTLFTNNARLLANNSEIKIYEQYKMPKKFPIIKAISVLKRYYLPTDKDYDNISINISKGDRYFEKVITAENAGFHR